MGKQPPQRIEMKFLAGLELLLQAAASGGEYLILSPDEWSTLEAWYVPFFKGLKYRWSSNSETLAATTAPERLVFVGLNLTRWELSLLAALAASDSDKVRHALQFLSLESDNPSVAEAGGVNNPTGGSGVIFAVDPSSVDLAAGETRTFAPNEVVRRDTTTGGAHD